MNNFSSIFLLLCDSRCAGCAQNCSNTNGSFVCSCGVGYVLADDDLDCLGNVSLFKYNMSNFSLIFLLCV